MRFVAAMVLSLLCALPAAAEQIGKVGVDWIGNDIAIQAFQDPKVPGVTCHLAYFDRSLLDRLGQGNWFEDPSNSAIQCIRTGPVEPGDIALGPRGESVFSESRSLIFKTLKVTRIYDATNGVLVYLAHSRQVKQGSAKMAISTVAVDQPPAAAR